MENLKSLKWLREDQRVEGHGGMLMAPWLDRPLSVAGRIIMKNGNKYEVRLVNMDRDLPLIPNVATT